MKKYFAIILIFLFGLTIFMGCSKKEDELDERELQDAERLIEGLTRMLNDIGGTDTLSGKGGGVFMGPPPGWNGPDIFITPDSISGGWYWIKLYPWFDEGEVDTLKFLLMQTPDIWGEDSLAFVTRLEIWLWQAIRDQRWIFFELDLDSSDLTHISGLWKWNKDGTWLEYVFQDMGTTDYSGTIEVNTSTNINLSAYFDFEEDGQGTGSAMWQEIEFVRYKFYAMPPDPYRGYFTLASEGWNVEHKFPKQ